MAGRLVLCLWFHLSAACVDVTVIGAGCKTAQVDVADLVLHINAECGDPEKTTAQDRPGATISPRPAL